MASSRKLRVQLQRHKKKLEVKAREKAKHKAEAEIKMRNKVFQKEVREALGFDRFKFVRQKTENIF